MPLRRLLFLILTKGTTKFVNNTLISKEKGYIYTNLY